MTMRKPLSLLTILLLTTILLGGCSPNYDKIFLDNNKSFDTHRMTFKSIANQIETKYASKGIDESERTLNVDTLSTLLKNQLIELGIGSIQISKNHIDKCDGKFILNFNVQKGWHINELKVINIIYSPCNYETKEGHHSYDGYHRDSWGQGDNWIIVSDTDFI
jgi:hypothetical protein